jgi:hypothetical protein
MQTVFDFLAGLSLGLFLLSGYTAYGASSSLHALIGLSTGIAVLLMHTVMFVFFIGTGRAVKDAVRDRGLPESFAIQDKALMARVIAPGSFGPLTIVVGSFLGSASAEIIRFYIHPSLIVLSMVVNAWAFVREREVIGMKRLHLATARAELSRIEGREREDAASSGAPPPPSFVYGAIALLLGLTAAGYYPYRLFIMGDRRAPSPSWLVIGVALCVVGAVLIRRHRPRDS